MNDQLYRVKYIKTITRQVEVFYTIVAKNEEEAMDKASVASIENEREGAIISEDVNYQYCEVEEL